MKKDLIQLSLLFFVITLICFACGDSQFRGYKQTDTGLYYKFLEENDDTLKAGIGDMVIVNMIYGIGDTVLFNSKNIPRDLEIAIDKSHFKGDIFEGLAMMSEGDSATFLISADSFFLITARSPQLPAFVDSGSYMYFNIKMLDVETLEEKNKKEVERLLNRKEKEQVDLQKYLEMSKITVKPTESGLYFIMEKKGYGPNPKNGEMVTVHLTVSLLDGQKIFSTRDRGEPMEYEFGRKFDTEGLEEGISMMRKGEKAKLIVPSKLAYGAEQRGRQVDSYSSFLYDIELVNIRSKVAYNKELEAKKQKQKAEEQKTKSKEMSTLQAYLKDNNITSKPIKSGLYYIETEEGKGIQPVVGNTVQVHYTGKLLDGTKFDSSHDRGEPFSFVLGQGQVIKGWDEGIILMKEGGKATLIIPSALGYGGKGAGNSIPPYSTLVFDVELVNVE
jgi:FKBP-type peptidyl-prolyl cis-trans isomerase